MNRDQKAAVVEELAEQIRGADAIFAVDYRGISVADAAELRNRLRDAQARFRVVKNSLTERATDQAGAEALRPMLEGPTALAFVTGDAALAAKALNDAARNLGTLEFKGGLMDGNTLSADDVRSIARLPAREVLHAQLVGTIASPLSGLVRTLNALIAGVAIQLKQIADQGLVSGEAPAPQPAAEAEPAAEPAGEAAEAAAEPTSEADSASAQDETAAAGEETRSASDADSEPPEAEAAPEPEAAAPEGEAEAAPEPEAEAVEEAPSGAEAAAPAEEPEAEPAAETEEPETEASADAPQAEEKEE